MALGSTVYITHDNNTGSKVEHLSRLQHTQGASRVTSTTAIAKVKGVKENQVRRIKSNVDGKYLMDSVPFSCCNPSSPRPCIQNQITNNTAHYSYTYQTDELNIWVRGCREALLSYYTGIMATNGAAVTLFFILQGSVLVSMRLLQTSMEKITGVEDVETDSEGFLLEKGLVETISSNLEKTKALFKSNTEETGGGGGGGGEAPAS